jgi:hypothetical protein
MHAVKEDKQKQAKSQMLLKSTMDFKPLLTSWQNILSPFLKKTTTYLTNTMAPELAGSSPYLQEPATGPYPEPIESTLHAPSQSPQDSF